MLTMTETAGEYGGRYSRRAPTDSMNWLQVLGTAELPHIDQGVRQHFHGKMSLLYVFKTQEQPLELVLPRKCPIHTGSQGMDGFVEQTLSSSLRVLSITRILFNVGDHAGVENALAIVRGIKTSVEIDIRASEVQTDLFGYLLQGFQTIWKQHHIRFIHGSDGKRRQHIAMVVCHGDDFLSLLVLVARVANPIAPFLATVLVPSPWRTRTSSFFSSAR